MAYTANFRCIAGCDGSFALDEIVYRCPTCGGLLEVVHDRAALRARTADEWKALFASRWDSGVWRHHEWIAPNLAGKHVVSLGEGNSHLTPVPRFAAQLGLGDVRVKQCGTSHSGSFKDLGMTVLVSQVKQMIALGRPIRAIACASTGDTSAALAAYAAQAGIPAIVVLPRGKISTAQLVQPLAMGALVLAIETDFDGCMAIVQQLAEREGVYLANSMNSLRLEGQKTVAFELAQQLGWRVPDWVVIPGGNLGNVSALAAGFELLHDLGLVASRPRICVAQAEAAAPLYASYQAGWAPLAAVTAGETQASAIRIGNPVSFPKAVRALQAFGGVVEVASEAELSAASAAADRDGLFTCPQTGVALAALVKLAARGVVTRSDRVVVISTASGLKFTDFKVSQQTEPAPLPAEYGAVRDALLRGLENVGNLSAPRG
ncbi:MAG TPA: threonine synthase [Kofleriaceae bacterium]|jgi:threonine synthase